jgi:outer membrane protein TolC
MKKTGGGKILVGMRGISIFCGLLCFILAGPVYSGDNLLSLEECIQIALANNNRTLIAKEGQNVARAQHEKVMSAYWPRLSIESQMTSQDKAPYFVMGETETNFTVAGPPVPGLSVDATVPEQKIKMGGTENITTDLTASYLLWDGGKRSALKAQAQKNIEIAGYALENETVQLIYEVKLCYYGLILAKTLRALGHKSLERMGATLDITERLYQQSVGGVKKTDYLRNKLVVASLAGAVAELDSNEELAKAALVNAMGLDWQKDITIDFHSIPYLPLKCSISDLIHGAYGLNIDLHSIDAALAVFDEKINAANADYMPMVTLFGNVHHLDSSFNKGVVSSANSQITTGGLNIFIPLFDGFSTDADVSKAKAQLRQLKYKKVVLEQALALQLKDLYLAANRASKQVDIRKEAMRTAEESCLLHEQAYELELVETRDVIESQLAVSSATAEYYRALYDHYNQLAKIEMVLGGHIDKLISEGHDGKSN